MNIDDERYKRQVSLQEFGTEGQQKLAAAKVLVIGAGGLGCPALLYLAAAGAGTIGIADDDVVNVTNLHRQVLFNMENVGGSKVHAACVSLHRLNPGITIITHPGITNKNALQILKSYDVIIDGTDNFSSKYIINDACVLLGKQLVYGSVSKFLGQLSVLNVANEEGITCNYRDLFPQPPADTILSCEEEGVLGVLPGIIGTMQAAEAIKLITGIGKPLAGRLLVYNLLNNESYIMAFTKCNNYTIPADEAAFMNMDYDFICEAKNNTVQAIDADIFMQMLATGTACFIDVRELSEKPLVHFPHKKMPLSSFKNDLKNIQEQAVVLFCASGARSLQAAQMLAGANDGAIKIYNLQKGIATLSL